MPTQRAGSEPETLPGSMLEEAEVEEDLDDLGSIDKLLAETDQGWDIEAQVLTLQQAAAAKEPSRSVPPARAPMPSRALHIPTPFELAPQPLAAAAQAAESPTPTAVGLPPPRRPSKAPPPLPRKPATTPGAVLRTPEP